MCLLVWWLGLGDLHSCRCPGKMQLGRTYVSLSHSLNSFTVGPPGYGASFEVCQSRESFERHSNHVLQKDMHEGWWCDVPVLVIQIHLAIGSFSEHGFHWYLASYRFQQWISWQKSFRFKSDSPCCQEVIKENDVQANCSEGRQAHNCMMVFRENSGIVKKLGQNIDKNVQWPLISWTNSCFLMRNWRGLWASLPRNARKQRLLDMMRETPGSVKFAGIRVCARAFQKLSGVSAGLMQEVRELISKKVVNVWSDSSLSWMQIRETSKAKRYLDARSWIEIYGETYGEKSPMSLKVYLPAGRKYFYHSQYEFERTLG